MFVLRPKSPDEVLDFIRSGRLLVTTDSSDGSPYLMPAPGNTFLSPNGKVLFLNFLDYGVKMRTYEHKAESKDKFAFRTHDSKNA